ncbi:ATP-binding protein [Azospirillum sp. RWY-5-1]|uniref:ATP-binding protein n=1 Tax=Azospirillum oleiclasticum TaxID=2735135 RepID=A0ABX2TBS5_9PROT|nr:ATP-binding protein [Azospirillum oleiclasticum]NYZ21750.1 ATP-binding protein [Azospirillum oleiclasticum]
MAARSFTFQPFHKQGRTVSDSSAAALLAVLTRIADALERQTPPPPPPVDLSAADAFVWHADPDRLEPVPSVNRVDIALLQGVERQRDLLLDNTRRFAAGLPANNALLWGARGMGKSSLVKSVHAAVIAERPGTLALVEIHREDIPSLPRLLALLRGREKRFVLFCDDLSFTTDDTHYKSLKAVLEGGVEGRPDNVLFYATSNRRHLMPRDMIENERSTAINPAEAVEEKVSLSDRFGLWLGFHNCDQPTFFAMVEGYADAFGLTVGRERLHAEAVEWSVTRGSRSGRVAWQFIQDLAGRLGTPLR